MRSKRVQEQVEAIVECKVDDVIDLSVDISWTPIKINSEKESHDEEEDVKVVAEPSRT